MDSISDSANRMFEIEARQDEALQQLAELERRVEQVLAEHLAPATLSVFPPTSEADEAISTPASKAA